LNFFGVPKALLMFAGFNADEGFGEPFGAVLLGMFVFVLLNEGLIFADIDIDSFAGGCGKLVLSLFIQYLA
jgi:hypothetical protein